MRPDTDFVRGKPLLGYLGGLGLQRWGDPMGFDNGNEVTVGSWLTFYWATEKFFPSCIKLPLS